MRKRLIIVELVGPAGTGKSTLTKVLTEQDELIEMGVLPSIRNIRNFPFLLWNAILLGPVFFACCLNKNDKSLTRQQMAAMVILKSWHRVLKCTKLPDSKTIILDQGPVYMLTDLLRRGPKNLRLVSPWWRQTCENWADILNIIICLDAPDPVLLPRIRSREQDHGIKHSTDMEAVRILEQCRAAQGETLSSMSANSQGPKVVYFNTSQISLPDVTEKIRALCHSYMER